MRTHPFVPIVAVLAFFAFVASSFAESGLTGAPILQKCMGARAIGMGSAFVAVPDPSNAFSYNPAAIGAGSGLKPDAVSRHTLATTYEKGLADDKFGFLQYTKGMPWGGVGAGILYYNSGKINLNLTSGAGGSVTAQEDTVVMLGMALKPVPGLFLGGTYKYVRLNLAEEFHATSHQADAGALWRITSVLSVGAAMQNMGGNIKFESAGDPPPTTTRIGAACHLSSFDIRKIDSSVDIIDTDITFTADWVKIKSEKESPRVGFELAMKPSYMGTVSLRVGYLFNRDIKSMTYGCGFKHKKFVFDFGIEASKNLSNPLHISFTFHL